MRIKQFEAYQAPEYYTEITEDDYYDQEGLMLEIERFTDPELHLLNTTLAAWEYKPMSTYSEIYPQFGAFRHQPKTLTFFKHHDEFYYVGYHIMSPVYQGQFFKCDQWAGLQQWLDDYRLIVIK